MRCYASCSSIRNVQINSWNFKLARLIPININAGMKKDIEYEHSVEIPPFLLVKNITGFGLAV